MPAASRPNRHAVTRLFPTSGGHEDDSEHGSNCGDFEDEVLLLSE